MDIREPIDLAGLIDRAEQKPHVIAPEAAFGTTEEEPAILVMREESGGLRHVDLLDAAKARRSWREELADHPFARRGVATLAALASFVAWVLRFKKPETVIFATPERLTAIIDYHQPEGPDGKAGHRRHQGVYAFPFSRAWQFWSKVGAKLLSQKEFAELIEDHVQDLTPPNSSDFEATALLGVEIAGPSTMLTLARGLEVRAKMSVKDAITLASGEAKVSFEEEHETSRKDGSAITVPGAFMVSIPIYEGGDAWRLAVRLRYRLVEGRIMWLLALNHADAALETSFEETLKSVEKDTGVPVFRGRPEQG